MDNKDARRSRVPAGTFGRSDPPPGGPSADESTDRQSESGRERRRFTSTLTGEEQVSLPEAEQVESTPEAPRRQVTTLVGHPGGPPVPPANVAPVLSPPKWRGASAYLDGEEPQPRVSSIPTPPPTTAQLEDDPSSSVVQPRSRVTTKIGHPGPAQAERPQPNTAAIGDAIQQMLDSQASVPMLDDGGDYEEDDDLPIEELSPDELLEAASDTDEDIAEAAVALPTEAIGPDDLDIEVAQAAPEPSPPRQIARIELKPSSRPAIRELREPASTRPVAAAADAPAAQPSSSARALAQPQPSQPSAAAEAPALAQPQPPEPARAASSTKASSAASPVPRSEPAKFNAKLPPREGSPAPRIEEMRTDLGSVLIAAMLVIGFGGWWFTRSGGLLSDGGYPGPEHRALANPEPAAPVPPPPLTQKPTPASAAPAASTTSAVPPANAAAAVPPASRLTKAGAKRGRGETTEAKPAASTAARSAPAVPRVTAHDVAQLAAPDAPETPTKDKIRASLEAIRGSVSACAHGLHGVAQLDITVSNSGFVSYAVVGGDFAGTPEGSCIARAARAAQFEPFKKPRFRVIYPFSL